MANRYMWGCSISIIIRKMQIKSTVSYCLTCVRLAIINKTRNNKCLQGCGDKGTLMHCWWKINATTVENSKLKIENSLAFQWLEHHPSNGGATGSILGQGTRIPHGMWPKKIFLLKKIKLPIFQQFHFWVFIWGKQEHWFMHLHIHRSILYSSQNMKTI